METEFRESSMVVRGQERALRRPIAQLLKRLARHPPCVILTCARGSSAHAATLGKHLIETRLGIPVSEVSPNVVSIYGRQLKLARQLFVVISQSGRSDDLIEVTQMASAGGAITVGILNDLDSPLAAVCQIVLPVAAGPERSVAATKSFIGTCSVLLRLLAIWSGDSELMSAIDRLPARLDAAADLDWSVALSLLAQATSVTTIGRGPTLAVAREAALKLKETSHLHAEAFSSAEFQHGPLALITHGFPVLLFSPTDQAAEGMLALAASLARKGASVFTTGYAGTSANQLPTLPADYPETDALCLIQSFYGLAVRVAQKRELDADHPRHLNKVTRTR